MCAYMYVCMYATFTRPKYKKLSKCNFKKKGHFSLTYSETLNKEYIERIHQMSYSSLSDKGML